MPTLTALENIQVPMFESALSHRERVERASRLIDEVGLADRRDHRPGQLSVGQRQRVAIARALANEPCMLLADEPTGNLDSQSQDEIIGLLHRLRDERKLTLVIVTHSHEVAQAADRRVSMKDGLVQSG
jgi:putative ABC transport system ATP-binding protein